MYKYLLIGILAETELFTFSREFDCDINPGDVRKNGEVFAQFLCEETKTEPEEPGTWFDKVLVVYKGEVIEDLNIASVD